MGRRTNRDYIRIKNLEKARAALLKQKQAQTPHVNPKAFVQAVLQNGEEYNRAAKIFLDCNIMVPTQEQFTKIAKSLNGNLQKDINSKPNQRKKREQQMKQDSCIKTTRTNKKTKATNSNLQQSTSHSPAQTPVNAVNGPESQSK